MKIGRKINHFYITMILKYKYLQKHNFPIIKASKSNNSLKRSAWTNIEVREKYDSFPDFNYNYLNLKI